MFFRLLAGLLPVVITLSPVWAQTQFKFYEPVRPPHDVQVIANGGMGMLAPECSVEAIRECSGDFIEWAAIDVRLTKDGHHVVIRNEQLPAGKDGATHAALDLTLDELRHVDLGIAFAPRFSGVHPATLSEVLAAAKDRVNLVLNCRQVAPEILVNEIHEAGMEQQVLLSGDPAVLAETRSLATTPLATIARWTPGVESLEVLRSTQKPTVVELAARDCGPAKCRILHGFGIKVLANVVGVDTDDTATWDHVWANGADFVLTDRPAEFQAYRTRRGAEVSVQIALHRGANRYAPENTLPAITSAVALGADYIEIDIRTTQDGAFVLMHDSSLNRTTSGTGKVNEHTAAAIAALDAGSWFGAPFKDLRVPTLDQGLAAIGDTAHAYLDAKDIAPEALLAAIHRHDLIDRHVVYQSVDYCQRLKALDPDVRLLPPLRTAAELDAVAELAPYGVDAKWSILSQELIDRCHAKGIKVFSDALGDHESVEDYRQAIGWGIDVIQTDYPLRVLRAIELEANNERAGSK